MSVGFKIEGKFSVSARFSNIILVPIHGQIQSNISFEIPVVAFLLVSEQ